MTTIVVGVDPSSAGRKAMAFALRGLRQDPAYEEDSEALEPEASEEPARLRAEG